MTLAQLQQLYDAGWDIGNHTSTHADLSTLDGAAVAKELTDCADFLVDHRMPRAARHVAYPDGSYDDSVLRAMAATHMDTGRTVDYRPEPLPFDDPYLLPGAPTNSTQLTVAQIESDIDRAVTDGATIELFFHAIGPRADSYTQSITDFTAICDYVHKLDVPVLTISELYALNKE
jgi:peptidoglycan/xylan/chitin deacetylase (PgdA/CDA1 family)